MSTFCPRLEDPPPRDSARPASAEVPVAEMAAFVRAVKLKHQLALLWGRPSGAFPLSGRTT